MSFQKKITIECNFYQVHPTNHKKEIKEFFSGYQTSTKLNVILKSIRQPQHHFNPKRPG
ncbi:hypothetical protein LguiB_023137 [Lonicera macranthoides]